MVSLLSFLLASYTFLEHILCSHISYLSISQTSRHLENRFTIHNINTMHHSIIILHLLIINILRLLMDIHMSRHRQSMSIPLDKMTLEVCRYQHLDVTTIMVELCIYPRQRIAQVAAKRMLYHLIIIMEDQAGEDRTSRLLLECR